jgi:hypothetical protein
MATKEDEPYLGTPTDSHLAEEQRIQETIDRYSVPKPKSATYRRVEWGGRILIVLVLLTIGGVWLFHKAHPGGLPNGVSLTAFDGSIKSDLASAPFRISGIAAVSCVMPNSWVPGKTFTCYAYASSKVELGTVTGTVVPTPPNYAFEANLVWVPGP